MAEEPDSLETTPSESSTRHWSHVWQLPVLLLGLGLLLVGVILIATREQQSDDFPGKLDEIAVYLKANNLEKAEEELESLEEPIERAKRIEQARYQLYWGDLIYQQQHAKNWDLQENHQHIDHRFLGASKLGQPFDPLHLQRWAETLVALGEEQRALSKLDEIADGPAQYRYSVIKQIVEHRRLRLAGRDPHQLLPLLNRFMEELNSETDPQRRRSERIWAVCMRAQGDLDAGRSEQAISFLQKRLARFMDEGGDQDLAPVMVLMGRAYQRFGDFAESERWYLGSQQKLSPSNPLNAEVLVGLGQLAVAKSGDVRTALGHFSQAETDYPSTPVYIEALIGRADCEARLGANPDALEHFRRAIKRLMEDPFPNESHDSQLTNMLRSQHRLNLDRADYELALEYLQVLLPLHKAKLPADLLAQFAVTYERIAQKKNAQALAGIEESAMKIWAVPDGDESAEPDQIPNVVPETAARRLAFQEAAINFEKAAEFYLRHAHAVTISDDAAFGDGLWKAAANYDKAQLWKKAIDVYAEFVKARPDDPRQLKAINHLGLAYQANGQHFAAANLFKDLIEQHEKSPEAYASLVPLGRCHVALRNVDDAIRVLKHVLEGHPAIRPDSEHYREALIELGKLYYRQERFEDAIQRLDEAITRYGDSPESPTLRFMLADANRQSVEQIDESLQRTLPQSKRLVRQTERTRRLEQAQIAYSQVISELESVNPSTLSPMQQRFYRNAYFYRADCAYDMGRYEQAIQLYDLAAKRWENHPASMVALIQIVNSYCALDRVQEAAVANKRARWQLKRIPDDAFDDPTLPMDRQHWQDWLRWTSELNLFGQQASVAN